MRRLGVGLAMVSSGCDGWRDELLLVRTDGGLEVAVAQIRCLPHCEGHSWSASDNVHRGQRRLARVL
jgi:hypothetical protein